MGLVDGGKKVLSLESDFVSRKKHFETEFGKFSIVTSSKMKCEVFIHVFPYSMNNIA